MLVFLFCPLPEDVQRMKGLLSSYDLPAETLSGAEPVLDSLEGWKGDARLILFVGDISSGFVMPAIKLAVLSEEEIFVKKARRLRSRPVRTGYFIKSFGDLQEGDFVVHTDFGIGIYRGLKKIAVRKIENDFLVIEYSEGDKLYIPVNALEKIQRYVGPDGYVPKIDRMGGTSWEAVKERVKKSVRDYAEELVSIYAPARRWNENRLPRRTESTKSFARPLNLKRRRIR